MAAAAATREAAGRAFVVDDTDGMGRCADELASAVVVEFVVLVEEAAEEVDEDVFEHCDSDDVEPSLAGLGHAETTSSDEDGLISNLGVKCAAGCCWCW